METRGTAAQRAALLADAEYLRLISSWPEKIGGRFVPQVGGAKQSLIDLHADNVQSSLEDWILVVSDGEDAYAVTAQGGAHISRDLDTVGLGDTVAELVDGWDFAAGLWIVEGRYGYRRIPGGPEDRDEWESDWTEGESRPATPDDLRLLSVSFADVYDTMQNLDREAESLRFAFNAMHATTCPARVTADGNGVETVVEFVSSLAGWRFGEMPECVCAKYAEHEGNAPAVQS